MQGVTGRLLEGLAYCNGPSKIFSNCFLLNDRFIEVSTEATGTLLLLATGCFKEVYFMVATGRNGP